MKRSNRPLSLATALTLSLSAFSVQAERPDHFEGKEAETLTVAYENLTTYNRKLQTLLEGELTAESMAAIHQLTYTLENALQTIDSEVDGVAETLEAVHLASERNKTSVTKEKGEQYLRLSSEIVRKQ